MVSFSRESNLWFYVNWERVLYSWRLSVYINLFEWICLRECLTLVFILITKFKTSKYFSIFDSYFQYTNFILYSTHLTHHSTFNQYYPKSESNSLMMIYFSIQRLLFAEKPNDPRFISCATSNLQTKYCIL